MDFERKIGLVTGGSKGIGKSISVGLAEKSNDLIITYFRDKKNALITQNEIKELGVNCYIHKVDLSKLDQVEKLCIEIKDNHKQLNFLINNAATGINKNSLNLTNKHWEWVMNTNSKSPWILSKNLSEIMPKKSSIINITSLGSQRVLSNYFSVGISKATLESMTRYLAIELGKRGIRVNSISPGIIKTNALDSFPEESDINDSKLYETPAGKPLEGKDVSHLVNFLISEESEMIRGQNIIIDGGRSLNI
tara:strand:+ start:1956 stop:2705 length:750 start_codon:yes stop_codon:yes gene_type:complete